MWVSKRELKWMGEQNDELILNPLQNKAKKQYELKELEELKNRITYILITNDDVVFLNLTDIENITSVWVLRILLNDLQNETSI